MVIRPPVDFEEDVLFGVHFDEPRAHLAVQGAVHLDGAMATGALVDQPAAHVGHGTVVDAELVNVHVLVRLPFERHLTSTP